ncbi:regulatory protein, gntR family [Nonomuraea wenchangensis]|uniref:Regulatory protein, gntR family n=1 Tax=Nonomuraea wenchangensis TaxID=568860 RepID=A0A1I0ENX3_9ACTN|nr:regulatory protein, gntR family [Nonomuraea wenchangensis]
MYLQVAAQLRARIESGEWPPRRRLPSVVALEHEYGVARNTVLKAIKHLRDTGYVYTVSNWGTVVKAGADTITVVVMAPGSRAVVREATAQERERLDLAEGAHVLVVEKGGEVEVLPAETVEIRGPES